MSFRLSKVAARMAVLLVAILTVIVAPAADAFSPARPFAIQQKLAVTASSLSFHHPVPYSTKTVVEHYMTSSSDDKSSNEIKTPFDRPVLAGLDLLAILLFAYIGTSSHNSASDYLAVLAVAVPFLISWFSTTPFLGLYKQDATSDKMTALTTTAKGWIVAIPLGCVLRGIIKGYVPPLPFVVVTMIATLVVLAGTRVAYTTISEKGASSNS